MTPEQYLLDHSLDQDYIKKAFNITFTKDKITIPIYGLDKKLLYCKYRHLEGDAKYTFDTGSHPTLFPIHKILNKDNVVLCEGEMDAIRLWQEGIPAVTTTSGVKSFSPQLASQLSGKTVYVCLDTDEAGISQIGKYLENLTLAKATPRVIHLPPEHKDVSDFFTDGGTKKEFIQLMKTSQTKEEYDLSNQPEEWKLETATQLMQRSLPDEEWFIDRIVPSEGFTFIVGAEATGKSFYTLSIAKAIVTNTKWLDTFEIKKQTNILFIDKENSPRRRKSRLFGLGIDPDDTKITDRLHWVMYPQYFQLADPNQEDGLSLFAKSLSDQVKRLDVGLIIIDSFADVMVGNENAASDVQAFFDAMRILFPDKAVIVLHHENKPSQGISRTSAQRVRGSTNITAQIVSGFRAFAIPKTSNQFVIEQFKAGDTEKLKPFKVELVSETDPYTQKTHISSIKHNGEYYDEESKAELARETIEEFFVESPVALRQEIISHCLANGIGNRTIERVLREMIGEGILEKTYVGRRVNYLMK